MKTYRLYYSSEILLLKSCWMWFVRSLVLSIITYRTEQTYLRRHGAKNQALILGENIPHQIICHVISCPARKGTNPDSVNGTSSGMRQVVLVKVICSVLRGS